MCLCFFAPLGTENHVNSIIKNKNIIFKICPSQTVDREQDFNIVDTSDPLFNR